MTKLDELLEQINKEGLKDYGFTQAEMDFFDLLNTLSYNDRDAYLNYVQKYNEIRNEKLKELE